MSGQSWAFSALMLFYVQTDIASIVEQGTAYMMICTTCSFALFGEVLFERLLQSTGKTVYTLITQGTGALVNIILDSILILGWFGLPAMGVKGAAIATVLTQWFWPGCLFQPEKEPRGDLKA